MTNIVHANVSYTDVTGEVTHVNVAGVVSHVGITAAVSEGFFIIRQGLDDVLAVAESINVSFGKGFNDSVLSLDSIAFNISANHTDAFNGAESIALSTGRGEADVFTVTDSETLNVGKVSTDFASAQVNIDLSTTKNLNDGVGATDDFLGESNIDDDQTMLFNKALSKVVSASDNVQFENSYIRSFANTFSAQDYPNVVPNKVLAHQAGFTDSINIVLAAGRVLDSLASVEELVGKLYTTTKQDYGSVSERAIIVHGKVNSDSGLVTDSGSLYSQSYTEDFSYFAEEYVGDSLTF